MAGITPLIKKLNPNGSLVTMQSAGEDLTFTNGNPSKKMYFSKYALLEIPNIEAPVNGANNIQFNSVEGHFTKGLSTATPAPEGDRVDLAESLQNYLMNIETLIIRSERYDVQADRTVSERLFFKWLKEIGAIRYREAVVGEKNDNITDAKFVEEDNNDDSVSGDLYNRVIKYVGELDMEGNQIYSANAYKELYFYVPAQNGSTPVVMFDTISDDNYSEGMTIKSSTLANSEFIQGRDADDEPTIAGLSVQAFYDMDVPLSGYDYTMNGVANDIWFSALAPNGPDAYFTDIAFNDPTNDTIVRTNTSTSETITYKRSRLDGVSIDWEKSNYKAFNENALLKTFNDFNATDAAGDFSFNAIAVYYDLYDTANPDVSTTNLYGVIFLDDLVTVSASGAKIEPLTKIKPDKITRKQGNAYGIVLNLKTDVSAGFVDSDVQVSVNDYSTFSMVLFSDAMQRIGLADKNYEKLSIQLLETFEKISNLESLILTDKNRIEILKEIEGLRNQILDVQNAEGITDLIDQMNTQINQILSGQSDVNINLLFDFIAKDGLKISADEGNNFTFRNLRQRYAVINELNLDTDTKGLVVNVAKLGAWDTLLVHDHGGIKTAEGNIEIFIEDKVDTWKTGQTFEIEFNSDISWNSFGVVIYTDATNRFNLAAPYRKLIGVIPNIEKPRPSIKIVCKDADKYEFVVLSDIK